MNDVPFGLIVTMIVGALAVVVINDWQKRRLAERSWEKGEKPNRKYLNHRTDWGLVVVMTIVVVGGAAIGTQWNTFSPESRETFRHLGAWLIFSARVLGWVIGAMLALVVLLVILVNVRSRFASPLNREFAQIRKLGLEGHITVAIDQVQRIIEGPASEVGTAVHQVALYHLAVLEGMRGNWREAMLLIRRLEQYSNTPVVFVPTKALALWQLGELQDAELGLRERVEANPDNAAGLAALGLFLVDTDRTDEATRVLQTLDRKSAERIANQGVIDVTEHLRHATNASDNIGPAVTGAEFDTAMRQLLLFSMEGIVFRDWKGRRLDSPQDLCADHPDSEITG